MKISIEPRSKEHEQLIDNVGALDTPQQISEICDKIDASRGHPITWWTKARILDRILDLCGAEACKKARKISKEDLQNFFLYKSDTCICGSARDSSLCAHVSYWDVDRQVCEDILCRMMI